MRLVVALIALAACGRVGFDHMTRASDATADVTADVVDSPVIDALMLAPHTLNFDTDTNGVAIANGTVVDTVYAAWGVTFERTGPTIPSCGLNAEIYANGTTAGISLPNTVSVCGMSAAADFSHDGVLGIVHAMFAAPLAMVCIDVRPDGPPDFATLEAYDETDTLIEMGNSIAGVSGPLCFTHAGIRGVRFAGGNNQFAVFDNLTITP